MFEFSFKPVYFTMIKENFSNLWCSDYRKIYLQVKKLNLHNFTHVCLGRILRVLIITPQAERNYPCPPQTESGGRNSKYLKQSKEIEQNWARLENVKLSQFLYLHTFWLLLAKFYFWKRNWALDNASTQFW